MKNTLIIDKLNGHDKDGKIGKINVVVGDSVQAEDVLFTIESGKGSLKYKSKYDGIVTDLTIKVGDVVVLDQEIGSIDGEEQVAKKSTGYSFGISKPLKKEMHAEVLIVGGGPGGYVAAIRSAQLGKKVILIEEDKLGGTCLNYGCIPTKALAHSTKVLKHIKEGSEFGFDVGNVSIDMTKLMTRKSEVVDNLVGGIEHLMEANDIEVIRGRAETKSETVIGVKTKKIDAEITFDDLIIATGSEPSFIPIEGHDLKSIMTSKDALEITEIPKSITIIGGGVIGMEFAFIFNALGSEVHVIEYMSEILALLDQDVVDVIKTSAEEKGIHIHSGARASGIHETQNNEMITTYMIDDKTYYISSEKVMMAVGRKPRLDSIDLDILGVSLNSKKNGIQVNEHMKTNKEHIYAIGDVTNIIQLAHVASHQGMVASEVIAGMDSKMSYEIIPSAIFTTPEIGHVGVTEREAIRKELDITISKFYMAANGKSVAMNETEGFVKVIYDNQNEYIIGASIVGGHGTDMIATLVNLIQQKVCKEDLTHVIYAHPTAAESIHEALLGLEGRGIHNG